MRKKYKALFDATTGTYTVQSLHKSKKTGMIDEIKLVNGKPQRQTKKFQAKI